MEVRSGARALHPEPVERWDVDRVTKIVFATVFGGVGGGALALAMSVLKPLRKVMHVPGVLLGSVITGLGLGGMCGAASGYLTMRPSSEEPTPIPPVEDPGVEPLPKIIEQPKAPVTTVPPVQVDETAAMFLGKYREIEEAQGKEAASAWLREEAGEAQTLLQSVSVPVVLLNKKSETKPAAAVLVVIQKKLESVRSTGRLSGVTVRIVMRNYEALASVFGEELAALLVPDTSPIRHVHDQERRRKALAARSFGKADDYMDPEFALQRLLKEPRVQEGLRTIKHNVASLNEGVRFGEQDGVIKAAYESLVGRLGLAQTQKLVGDTAPVTFTWDHQKSAVHVAVDEEAVRAALAEKESVQSLPDERSQAARFEAVEQRLALARFNEEPLVQTEETPFDTALWCFARNADVERLIQMKADYDDPKWKLGGSNDPERLRTDLKKVVRTSRECKKKLRGFVESNLARLPEGYGAPVTKAAERVIEQWKVMFLAAKGGVEHWDAEQRAQYDKAREEASWCLVELQQTLLVIEQKIGVDYRFCGLITALSAATFSTPTSKEKLKDHREKLQGFGERLRNFYSSHNERIALAVDGGREGVMEHLLGVCQERLVREGFSHPHLHLHVAGAEWPATLDSRESFVPVAFGLLTRQECGQAKATDATEEARHVRGQHYIAIINAQEDSAVRLDNLSSQNKALPLPAEGYPTSPGKLYVHRDSLETVCSALKDASKWSTPKWGGNNCWISSAMVLLAAYYAAGHALDPMRFSLPEQAAHAV